MRDEGHAKRRVEKQTDKKKEMSKESDECGCIVDEGAKLTEQDLQ